MNFTFGVITAGNKTYIENIIKSIENENIPNYEIIVVGGNPIKNICHIPFNESKKKMWITKKKNLITENAKYENIVYLHDYIKLMPGWYNGFKIFGNDFDVCMTKMETSSGKRYRDWSLCAWAPILDLIGEENRYERLLPYNETRLTKIQYISGAYWVAKRDFMVKYALDEELVWGRSEDIEWSYRARKACNFKMNAHSSVKLLKEKDPSFILASQRTIDLCVENLDLIMERNEKKYEETWK